MLVLITVTALTYLSMFVVSYRTYKRQWCVENVFSCLSLNSKLKVMSVFLECSFISRGFELSSSFIAHIDERLGWRH